MTAIDIRSLSKTYKNHVKALDQLTLAVPKGSVYGFLGPNGAGKTTTIKMLTGFIKPTHGHFKILNETVHFGTTKFLRHIGFLPDVPAFYPYMTGSGFLKLCADMTKSDAKVIPSLLETTKLTAHANKKIASYSRGMRQRLGLAQALIHNPDILILDEPVSALDPMGRKDVLDIIGQLKGEKTIFFSTHILSDAERICDHAAILDQGRLVLEGNIQKIIDFGGEGSILLEIDQNQEKIMDIIQSQSWCQRISQNEQTLSINILDKHLAGKEIPKIIYQADATLLKYQFLQPTLEDIFIKAVNHQ